jgi:hypothetical protein
MGIAKVRKMICSRGDTVHYHLPLLALVFLSDNSFAPTVLTNRVCILRILQFTS